MSNQIPTPEEHVLFLEDQLKRARDTVAEFTQKVAELEGMISMTVLRLGGTVEGRPTHRLNFLQRIDELRKYEHRQSESKLIGHCLTDFNVDYYEYDCGSPCTPDGCLGHITDIPVSFTVGGVTFHVDGAESGDFPDEKENINRVISVVKSLTAIIQANKLALKT